MVRPRKMKRVKSKAEINTFADFLPAEICALWAQTDLRVNVERHVMVSLPIVMASRAALLVAGAQGQFASLITEPDEVSLTIEESVYQTSSLDEHATARCGPFRVITFNLDLNPTVIGYFAPAARRLAEAGISIVPQFAFLKDHLLVREADLPKALQVLEQLIADCRKRLGL